MSNLKTRILIHDLQPKQTIIDSAYRIQPTIIWNDQGVVSYQTEEWIMLASILNNALELPLVVEIEQTVHAKQKNGESISNHSIQLSHEFTIVSKP